MELKKSILTILEKNNFSVSKVLEEDLNTYSVEISQYTPAGEDWFEIISFNGSMKDFILELSNRAFEFDVDDEAEIWIERRGHNNVPSSIETLIEDAKWKKQILEETSNELKEMKIK